MSKRRTLTQCRNELIKIGCVCTENVGWVELCNLAGMKITDPGIARRTLRTFVVHLLKKS